ncbi:hypothetical protein ES703_89098 [subsurface metagenome]
MPASSGCLGRPRIFLRNSTISGFSLGGTKARSVVKTMASHLPSKPVKSCRAMVTCFFVILTVPPSCQCHLSPSVPKMVLSGTPSMSNWNLPGAPGAFHGAAQSRVRTHTRYFPVWGNSTVVMASLTGSPRPWASRNGEPIWSINCWSIAQPPSFAKPSASTRTLCAPVAETAVSKKTANNTVFKIRIFFFILTVTS